MPIEPFIPETITVHLGRPDDPTAENVTVPFTDYIKNVASSELYPTWPENALRANIYAIISFTLNRVFTEWYRSQGYDFDITNSTQYDQSFVYGRDIYDPISRIVDSIFNNYIVRQGSVEPLFAVYCDGKVIPECGGLTQWGSVELANRGLTPYEILTHFYGDDINIATADVSPNIPSYPGEPLRLGDGGNDVTLIRARLNRISRNYPAIPRISPTDTVYDQQTESAVRTFQEIFDLPVTGEVDKATWYKINYIYSSVKRLADLNSEGLAQGEISLAFPDELAVGAQGLPVVYLQYYLSVIGAYYSAVLPVEVTRTFDEATENSVKSFQQVFGLPQTGVVDRRTWGDIVRAYEGIVENVPVNIESPGAVLYPGTILTEGMTSEYVRIMQEFLDYLHDFYPEIPEISPTGYFGPITRNAVTAFQRIFGLPETGNIGAETWKAISDEYYDLRFGYAKQPGQFPGYIIN